MKKLLTFGAVNLLLLICLLANSMFVGARHQVTTVENTTIWIHSDIPDTEKYVLDEEANKDKLYCKTKTDSTGKVVQTDWYYFCTGVFVKSEKADTCTKELRYPEYECEFASGSNADKVYCREVKGPEGTVVETRWFNYCSGDLVKTEEGGTCTKEFKSPVYKCYKHEVEEEKEVCEEKWECTDWSECADEGQTRVCEDKNGCGTTDNKPIETQTCKMPSFCGDGTCDQGEGCAICTADCGCGEDMQCMNGTCIKKSNTSYIVSGIIIAVMILLILYLKVFKKEGKEEEKGSKKEK